MDPNIMKFLEEDKFSGMVLNDSESIGEQSLSPGIGNKMNQQPVTSGSQQSGGALKWSKQVPFGMLLPIMQPHLDKDRAMQLHTLYFKRKKNEITKDGFIGHMRSIVGDQVLKMAVHKLQTQVGDEYHVSFKF